MNSNYAKRGLVVGVLALSSPSAALSRQDRGAPDAAKPAPEKSASDELIKAGERPNVVKMLTDYFNANRRKREESFPDLERKLDKALKPLGIDDLLKRPEALRLLIQDTVTRKPPTGKGHVVPNKKAQVQGSERAYEVEYAYCVPKNYNPQTTYPLILALPPNGVAGEKYLETFKDDGFRDKFVLVAPTLRAGESWFSEVGLIKLIGGALRTALDDFNVDPNRVFLDGTAEGGEDALKLGSSYADFFAGVIARSATPKSVTAANFKNLPLFVVYAADDPKMKGDALGKFLGELDALHTSAAVEKTSGRDHGACVDATPKILAWLADKTRSLEPAEIRWSTSEPKYGRAYWLTITKMETSTDAVAQVSAKADRSKNRIEITCTDVNEVRVCLNDKIVDLGKPIEITINGKPAFSGKKDGTFSHALDEYLQSGDPCRLFTASITLPVK
ncbi:MAG: hypothetical protein HYR85_24710 [Planctomycetes bacterium]|nr:hypothetical protein [Planctomycetota bacterium]MBI3846716.1 hypothetical protein [Planctomycetota bacterium]